jgi:hypothetical protein
MIRIKNFYWKIFFSAYWLAYDLGERKSPQWNAGGFLKIIFGICLCSFIFIADFINGEKITNGNLLIILAIVFSYGFNEFVINSHKSGFKKQLEFYEYLSKPERKKGRNRTVLFTLIFTFIFMILSMVINNPFVKTFLTR